LKTSGILFGVECSLLSCGMIMLCCVCSWSQSPGCGCGRQSPDVSAEHQLTFPARQHGAVSTEADVHLPSSAVRRLLRQLRVRFLIFCLAASFTCWS